MDGTLGKEIKQQILQTIKPAIVEKKSFKCNLITKLSKDFPSSKRGKQMLGNFGDVKTLNKC